MEKKTGTTLGLLFLALSMGIVYADVATVTASVTIGVPITYSVILTTQDPCIDCILVPNEQETIPFTKTIEFNNTGVNGANILATLELEADSDNTTFRAYNSTGQEILGNVSNYNYTWWSEIIPGNTTINETLSYRRYLINVSAFRRDCGDTTQATGRCIIEVDVDSGVDLVQNIPLYLSGTVLGDLWDKRVSINVYWTDNTEARTTVIVQSSEATDYTYVHWGTGIKYLPDLIEHNYTFKVEYYWDQTRALVISEAGGAPYPGIVVAKWEPEEIEIEIVPGGKETVELNFTNKGTFTITPFLIIPKKPPQLMGTIKPGETTSVKIDLIGPEKEEEIYIQAKIGTTTKAVKIKLKPKRETAQIPLALNDMIILVGIMAPAGLLLKLKNGKLALSKLPKLKELIELVKKKSKFIKEKLHGPKRIASKILGRVGGLAKIKLKR